MIKIRAKRVKIRGIFRLKISVQKAKQQNCKCTTKRGPPVGRVGGGQVPEPLNLFQ